MMEISKSLFVKQNIYEWYFSLIIWVILLWLVLIPLLYFLFKFSLITMYNLVIKKKKKVYTDDQFYFTLMFLVKVMT